MTIENEASHLDKPSSGSNPAELEVRAKKLAVGKEALVLAGIISGAIVGFSEKLGTIWNSLVRQVSNTSWLHVLIVSLIPLIAASFCVWIWHLVPLVRRARLSSKVLRWRLISTAAVVTIMIGLLWVFVSIRPHVDHEASLLFPQSTSLGGATISTYASNGVAQYSVTREREEYGPTGFAHIYFQLHGDTEFQNAGWVLYFLRGADLHAYKYLRFQIRGEQGNECIGVKAKDILGTEMFVMLDEHYLKGRRVTNQWQEARIDLSHFPRVNFGSFDNFSLFTNGKLVATRPQSIYVGGFRLDDGGSL